MIKKLILGLFFFSTVVQPSQGPLDGVDQANKDYIKKMRLGRFERNKRKKIEEERCSKLKKLEREFYKGLTSKKDASSDGIWQNNTTPEWNPVPLLPVPKENLRDQRFDVFDEPVYNPVDESVMKLGRICLILGYGTLFMASFFRQGSSKNKASVGDSQ